MIEILIISAIITARLHARDKMYAKQGLTPPGYNLIEKWLDGRKAKGKAAADAKPAKFGMLRYLGQRWRALWEVLAQDHAIAHERYLKERAAAVREGRQAPKKPKLKDRLESAWKWVVDTIAAPVAGTKPAPVADLASPSGPVIACDECGATLIDAQGGWKHPDGSACPKAQAEKRGNDQADEQPADPAAGQPESGEPGSQPDQQEKGADETSGPAVQPEGDEPVASEPIEGEPMTTPTTTQASGEVIGLTAAINYAAEVAKAHEAHSTGGGEQYRASLGQAKVGPETIQSAAAAQEASEIAGAAWRAHEAKLREQLAAKEATTAETGTKDFLLAE